MVISSNENLEVGKLYSIRTIYRRQEEQDFILPYPIDMFIFATRDINGEFDDSGLSVENGTFVLYLGYIECRRGPQWLPQRLWNSDNEEVVCFYKLLFPSGIGYVLDDGSCMFSREG